MKKITIVPSLPSEKQYAIRRWFYISVSAIFIGLGAATYFLVSPLLVYFSLKKEIRLMHAKVKNYATQCSSQQELKKKYAELHSHQTKINGYLQQLKNPSTHTAYIAKLCNNGIELASIRFNKQNVEIIIECETSEQAHAFAKKANESALFSQIKIISLQRNDSSKKLSCSITANAIF